MAEQLQTIEGAANTITLVEVCPAVQNVMALIEALRTVSSGSDTVGPHDCTDQADRVMALIAAIHAVVADLFDIAIGYGESKLAQEVFAHREREANHG